MEIEDTETQGIYICKLFTMFHFLFSYIVLFLHSILILTDLVCNLIVEITRNAAKEEHLNRHSFVCT